MGLKLPFVSFCFTAIMYRTGVSDNRNDGATVGHGATHWSGAHQEGRTD